MSAPLWLKWSMADACIAGDYWQWKVQTILMSPLDNSVEGNKGGSTSEPTTHAPTLGHLSWMYAYGEVETGLYIMWKRV